MLNKIGGQVKNINVAQVEQQQYLEMLG